MSFNKRNLVFLLLVMFMSIALACTDQSGKESNESDQQGQNTEEKPNDNLKVNSKNIDPEEKEEIIIAYQWSEGSFWERFTPVEESLGNVEIEYVSSNGKLSGFEEMFSAGIEPDIFIDQNVFVLQDLDLIYPLDELIEQTGFDLDMFDQPMLDSITAYDPEGRVIGFPDGTSNQALYYNKEIFDLFGEDYPDPEVPMTWPEVMELARTLTLVRDDTQYIGLENINSHILNQFAPNATDPDTGEVLVNKNKGYEKYLSLYEEYYSIPGINEENLEDAFLENRAAMVLAPQLQGMVNYAGDNQEQVDLVPFPVWPEQPTIGPLTGTTPMMIANYSEKKETALKVLEAYFDPENIAEPVKVGATAPPLSDPEIIKLYATEHEDYQGKNLDAWHVLQKASPEERVSRWDDFVDVGSAEKAIREGMDAVSALRELEEESEAKIAEAKAAE